MITFPLIVVILILAILIPLVLMIINEHNPWNSSKILEFMFSAEERAVFLKLRKQTWTVGEKPEDLELPSNYETLKSYNAYYRSGDENFVIIKVYLNGFLLYKRKDASISKLLDFKEEYGIVLNAYDKGSKVLNFLIERMEKQTRTRNIDKLKSDLND